MIILKKNYTNISLRFSFEQSHTVVFRHITPKTEIQEGRQTVMRKFSGESSHFQKYIYKHFYFKESVQFKKILARNRKANRNGS